jgi:hypothetical protein
MLRRFKRPSSGAIWCTFRTGLSCLSAQRKSESFSAFGEVSVCAASSSRLKPGGKYEMATLELVEETPLEHSAVVELVKAAVALNALHGDPTNLTAPTVNRAA